MLKLKASMKKISIEIDEQYMEAISNLLSVFYFQIAYSGFKWKAI